MSTSVPSPRWPKCNQAFWATIVQRMQQSRHCKCPDFGEICERWMWVHIHSLVRCPSEVNTKGFYSIFGPIANHFGVNALSKSDCGRLRTPTIELSQTKGKRRGSPSPSSSLDKVRSEKGQRQGQHGWACGCYDYIDTRDGTSKKGQAIDWAVDHSHNPCGTRRHMRVHACSEDDRA